MEVYFIQLSDIYQKYCNTSSRFMLLFVDYCGFMFPQGGESMYIWCPICLVSRNQFDLNDGHEFSSAHILPQM